MLLARPPYLPYPPQDHSTKQHLEWGRQSGNIQSLIDIYVIFYPSFIQMLLIHQSRQHDVTIKHADSLGDHLDSNRVPPHRVCMTLGKLSRLPKLRGGILEMRETVSAPGVMMRITPTILYLAVSYRKVREMLAIIFIDVTLKFTPSVKFKFISCFPENWVPFNYHFIHFGVYKCLTLMQVVSSCLLILHVENK